MPKKSFILCLHLKCVFFSIHKEIVLCVQCILLSVHEFLIETFKRCLNGGYDDFSAFTAGHKTFFTIAQLRKNDVYNNKLVYTENILHSHMAEDLKTTMISLEAMKIQNHSIFHKSLF